MNKKILLTGVSGFVGSHILRHILVNTDWNVVGIASWKHKGTPERIEETLKGHPEWKDRVEIITHDLVSPFTSMTKKRIGKCDIILNVAAESHVDRSITEPRQFIENNTQVALNMLEYARECPPEVFLQFSTDEVYGVAPLGTDHKEWSPIIPSNPYSASKACQEAIAISYWRTYNVPLILTNTMNILGQFQDSEKYVARLIRKINNEDMVTVHGTPTDIGSRYYIHARNVADAVLYIVNNLKPALYNEGENLVPDRYNIVGEIELNNLDLAKMVAKIIGKPLNYEFMDFHKGRSGHDRRYSLDGEKLKGLGWTPPIDFETSLSDTVKWTLSHPEWI